MKWLPMLFLIPVAFACVVPTEGMRINSSVKLCTDVYYLNKGLTIASNNVVLNCNGAVLKSWQGGKGITIENVANVSISDCRILNYWIGFSVRNSSKVLLTDNHLLRNTIGGRFVGVTSSATFNYDVSLEVPIEVERSSNNVFSLSNKPVSGSWCLENFCNQGRSAIATFMAPRTNPQQMRSWLKEKLTGSERLRKIVFDGLLSR